MRLKMGISAKVHLDYITFDRKPRMPVPVKLLILMALLILIFSSGCQSAGKVLDPLPAPAYINYHPRRVRPVVENRTRTSIPDIEVRHPWMPLTKLSNRWYVIVVHHTATDVGSLADVQNWHLGNGWEHGCGYHFVIGNGTRSPDGRVEPSSRWRQQIHGAHTKLTPGIARAKGLDDNHYNDHGIGIALVGNFDKSRPSKRQMASLAELVKFLMDRCHVPITKVYGHRDLKPTSCPGKNFSMYELKSRLR